MLLNACVLLNKNDTEDKKLVQFAVLPDRMPNL